MAYSGPAGAMRRRCQAGLSLAPGIIVAWGGPAMTVVCRLLGALEVLVDGKPIDTGHPRQQSVLAVLLAEANQVVGIESLIDRVWGESPPSAARGTVYAHVARLRRALAVSGEVVLTRRARGYVIEVDPMTVDLHRFRSLAAQARADDDDQSAAILLSDALALW